MAHIFDRPFFDAVLYAWFGIGAAAFAALLFAPAPYGRHGRPGWGPALDPRAAWMAMELPAMAVMAALFATSGRTSSVASLVFCAMWEVHYVNRALVFPLRLAKGPARMPASVAALGIVFNLINGYVQGGWLYRVAPAYGGEWLRDPRFLCGAVLFFAGMAINWHADAVLRGLRWAGETAYRVPQGGLFRWVSCPNYLGEIVEWTGWAVATWSVAGASFAFWTAANLVPRAMAHHHWYRQRFADYPKERRAIVPY